MCPTAKLRTEWLARNRPNWLPFKPALTLQHVVEAYALSVGEREPSRVAHYHLEELAGPLDLGIVEGGWSDAFRQLKEEIQQATSGI